MVARGQLWTPPNLLSLTRMAMLPLLWWCAVDERTALLGWGILVAAVTDIADGWLARRLGMVTALGSKLDSLADNLLIASVVAWIPMMSAEARTDTNLGVLAVGVATWLVFLAVGLAKFGRLANLHLWTAKVAAVVFVAWVVATFTVGFAQWLYLVAITAWIVCNLEGAAVLLTRDRVDERIGSILRPRG